MWLKCPSCRRLRGWDSGPRAQQGSLKVALASPPGPGASGGSARTTQLQKPGADAAPCPPPTSLAPHSATTLPCPRQSSILTPRGWPPCPHLGPSLPPPHHPRAASTLYPGHVWFWGHWAHVPAPVQPPALGAGLAATTFSPPGHSQAGQPQVLTSQCPRGGNTRVSVPESRPVETSAPTMSGHDQGLLATAGWQSPGVTPRLQRLLLDSLTYLSTVRLPTKHTPWKEP